MDAVRLIAGQLTVSLGNAQLYASLEGRVAERTEALAEANRQLEVLSLTDPLTGLGNRRRFGEMLQVGWDTALRGGRALAILMIDVDHFKRYNDQHGHQAGDECLRQVAEALAASARGGPVLVCRYGGEEFVIVVPDADDAGGIAAGERARAAVAALRLPHPDGAAAVVTVSVGVASVVPAPGDTREDLVARADAALYRAKALGRNRVHLAPPV
jgi:diguanylate cyclase (GGDEF)-like protein